MTERDSDAQEHVTPLNGEFTTFRTGRGLRLGEASVMTTVMIPGERKLPAFDELPSLLGRLRGPDSAHGHKYSDGNTVFRLSCDAEDTPVGDRTAEQTALLDDLETLRQFTYSCADMQEVYAPDELHGLVSKLQLLRQKNRPDFDGVEGELIDFVLRHRTLVDKKTADGIVKRERDGTDGRRGMQWSTLKSVSNAASTVMLTRLQRGSETRKYVVAIDKDPDIDPYDKKANDIRPIYQFVALSHAFAILDERNAAVTEGRHGTFLANQQVIEEWYEESKDGLEKLPTDHHWLGADYKGNAHKAGARAQVRFQMDVLRERRDGDEKFGVRKNFTVDPVGAINAQLRLGHMVEEIRAKLTTGESAAQEDIIPLDI